MSDKQGWIAGEEYSGLLIENANFHLKVRAGKAKYDSTEYRSMQTRLTEIEREMSACDIIKHAEMLFPKVGP